MWKRTGDVDDSYKGDFTANCPLHAGIGSNPAFQTYGWKKKSLN